jgi:hypothetical protein
MRHCNKNKEVARSYSGRAMPFSFCNGFCNAGLNAGRDQNFVQIVNLYKPFYSRRV